MPRVLNRHTDIMTPGARYIGRGTPYGNPYRRGIDGTRNECIKKFEQNVLPHLDVSALRGVDLVCSCKPRRCHGDSILIKANCSNLEDFI